MKKARRGMLFSLLSLVFALAVTVSSTYAWFMVNTTVTASNMQVRVKSDTTYLVITKTYAVQENGALDTLQTSETMTAPQTIAVYPVRYNESATPASGYEKWETNVGTAYDNGAPVNQTYDAVATANVGNYTVHYTFYVGLTHTTALPATHLVVSALSAEALTSEDDTFLPAVSALVECREYGQSALLGSNDYEDITTIGQTVGQTTRAALNTYADLTPNVALHKVYQIDVYAYINGENAVVKNSNAANLGAFTITMSLSVTQGVEA